jgi:hypothetical protein
VKYGLITKGSNTVIVLPDGTGLQFRRCKVAPKARVRPLDEWESIIVNRFVGELPRMAESAYTRPEYRNVVLEI